jgi:tRNA (guanine-N7-)-methyltransferase
MARTKLKKLSRVKDLPNVFDLETKTVYTDLHNYFKPGRLLTLEIGCGHGDYSVQLAKRFPERVFIGIDRKGARVFLGAMKAIEEKLDNVAFIIGRAEKLHEVFRPKSVEEINIPFPDPHIRRSSHIRRLISPNFLKIYKYLLIENGTVHLKTDNQDLYQYALKVIKECRGEILFSTEHFYNDNSKLHSEIVTSFEEYYIKDGRKIKFISFKF